MPRVIHFEIMADDPERAVAFYGDIFGWRANKWDGPEDYWMLDTKDGDEPGIEGAIMKRRSDDSSKGAGAYVCTISVPSFDEYSKKIVDHGGTQLSPKQEIPGVGIHGYFRDSENNVFGIMQADKNLN